MDSGILQFEGTRSGLAMGFLGTIRDVSIYKRVDGWLYVLF